MKQAFTITDLDRLIKKFTTLYPEFKWFEGICHGVSLTARDYILEYGLDLFDRRLELIYRIPTNELADRVNAIQSKVRNRETLSEDEKDILNIPPFFEKIILFQYPNEFPNLFEKSKAPKNQTEGDLAVRQLLTSEDNIARLHQTDGVYTKDDLTVYLSLFKKQPSEKEAIIAITLSSHNHTIILSYDLNKQIFALIDVNFLPTMYFDDPHELVKYIYQSFYVNNESIIIFSTTIECAKPNQAFIQEWVNHLIKGADWKEIHDVTKEKAQAYEINSQLSWLYLAVAGNYYELAESLIQYGANVNLETTKGATALHNAVLYQNTKMLMLLLLSKANPNQANQNGDCPLHQVSESGYIEGVELLIQHGAYVNVTNDSGITPLHFAAQNGYIEVARLLIRHGANVNVTNDSGITPLYLTVRKGNLEMIALLLLSKANPNQANQNGDFPLLLAAEFGYVETATLLLQYGADVNQTDKEGCTALFIAIEIGNIELVSLLLKKGADINIPFSISYETLSQIAKERGTESEIRSITKSIVSITPKELANIINHKEIIEMMNTFEHQQKNYKIKYNPSSIFSQSPEPSSKKPRLNENPSSESPINKPDHN